MSTNNAYLVLSYNVCYQAMCHDAFGSAAGLGQSCTWIVQDQLTICAQNMADFMDGAPGSVGYTNFDFVGTQESNNAQFLKAATKSSLANLAMIKSRSNATNGGHDMHMASFYDGTKYTLVESFCSQFNSHKTDRPFHLLILTNNATGDDIIFINVHAPHGSSQNTKHPGLTYSDFEAVAFDLSDAAKAMSKFDASKNYKLIMTGDFNETGWDWSKNFLGTMTWQPLLNAGLKTQVGISNVVFSCNQSDGCWHSENGQRGGDYVFSSGNPAKIIVPTNYKFAPQGACHDVSKMKSIWQSDHLPVMSEVS